MITDPHISETDHMTALGENLRRLRKERNVTQKQLAEVSGMSINSISNIEKGETGATANSLVKLSKGLGCTVDELLKGVEEAWKGTDDDHIDRLCEELKQLPGEGRSQIIHTLQALIVYWKYRRE